MNLDPNENRYISQLKDLMEDYLVDPCGSTLYANFVKHLELNPDEEEILSLHFFNFFDLNLDVLNNGNKKHLENLIFKYCRLDLEGKVEAIKQTKNLYFK